MTNYEATINENPVLDANEERRLADKIVHGKRGKRAAREKLFNSNIRLVFKYAQKAHKTYKITLDDLISEGHVALMNAVDKFDPAKFKARFSTYACKCISLHLNNAVVKCKGDVHVPQNILIKNKKYKDLIKDDPDITRQGIKRKLNLTEKALSKIESYSGQVVSLSTPTSDDGSVTIEDTVEDTKALGAYEEAVKFEERELLSDALEVLDKQDRDIIEAMYLGNEKKTLKEVGIKYGYSKERIRQRKEAALLKMKKFINRKVKYGD